jgi:APA family basic amino acid/polyamine antiporter
MISAFATLNGSILAGSRIPFAQARDGLFPQALAGIHPRFHTPAAAIVAQSMVAGILALTGQYEALFTKVIFAEWLFYALVTAGIFILRRREPALDRPYRTWGYPLVPAIFVFLAGLLLLNTFLERRTDSLWGLLMVASGIPAFFLWRARSRSTTS